MIPVVRESGRSASESVWNAFFRTSNLEGCTFISLTQVAAVMEGSLHWHPVKHGVELNLKGHRAEFFAASRRAFVDGRPARLEKAARKDPDGFWVPASFFASPAFAHATGVHLIWPPPPERKQSATPSAVHRPGEGDKKAIHRIVIDPGHGGKDPGALGPHGLEEKAVNLLFAQDLADALRDRGGYEVLLTRTDDTFIPLAQRAQLANRHDADLFISIHCNASLSPKLKGYEVYFLSETASDPHADAVARQENAALALEGNDTPTPRQVDAVLRSLVKNANINESSSLAALMDRHLGKRLPEPSLGVKQAAFYVLRGAEMPAVLIETGFLTNPNEEKLLQNASFRKRLVDGIEAGVEAYDERKQKERR